MSRFHPRLRTESDAPEPARKPRSHFAELSAAVEKASEGRVPVPVATVLKKVSVVTLTPSAVPAEAEHPAPERVASLPPASEATREPEPRSIWRGIVRAFVVLVLASALFGAMALAFWAGATSATGIDEVAVPRTPSVALPEEALPEFNEALRVFRDGEMREAGNRFDDLESRFPGSPAIAYVQLLLAMQEGRFSAAEEKAEACLAADYRRSDVLAIRAAMASLSKPPRFEEQKRLLQLAVLADPMNPTPYVELAGLERFLGEDSQAATSLSAAGLRLHPTDPQAVVKILQALMAVPESGAAETVVAASGDPAKVFAAALGEFRTGRRSNATGLLEALGRTIDPDLFFYVLNDPAFRPHLTESQVQALLDAPEPAPVAGVVPAPDGEL